MNVELYPFQIKALKNIRLKSAEAMGGYMRTHTPQIVSYTAPTGAGKTIIISALIESVLFGDEIYPDQADAIFVWLSDSPELNEQSRKKIEQKADKIRIGQCVMVKDESFDQEQLDDGHIYFINTQKLGKSSNLTKHGDGRQYTIWETLANTARNKSNRLYFIIDEAHRGMQGRDAGKATSIMQKFIKGSPEDKLPPMPVIIGMTATSERFHNLVGLTTSTVQYYVTTPDEVRSSGLLKEKIIITYPDTVNNEMAVLQAAADEWKNKWDHWFQYCEEQHYAHVYPIFLIQVLNSTNGKGISDTNLYDCLQKIEERTGFHFTEGQVVHAFGDKTTAIDVGGLPVRYVEPSRIADDRAIRIVFFKESLSTGWDCPRAETMMSFRRAVDSTYIAQLLGRMIRTPMQSHIKVDETLNDVHLYLPFFDSATVKTVIKSLQDTEGGSIPTEIEEEAYGAEKQVVYTTQPNYSQPVRPFIRKTPEGQITLEDVLSGNTAIDTKRTSQPVEINTTTTDKPITDSIPTSIQPITSTPEAQPQTVSENPVEPIPAAQNNAIVFPGDPTEQEILNPGFDRNEVLRAINDAGLLTYDVRRTKITNYLTSAFKLARLLARTRTYDNATEEIYNDLIEIIHKYVIKLKAEGIYEELVDKVKQFKLNTQVFDVFGETVDNYLIHDMFSTTDSDIDRQFRLAENRLGSEGIGQMYGRHYGTIEHPGQYMLDVIMFAGNNECLEQIDEYAKKKFHELNDAFRSQMVRLPDKYQREYDNIVSNGDVISKHNFRLPQTITFERAENGKAYTNHLFVDNSGTAKFKLNTWEELVIEEEAKASDFICWLRNPPRKSWSLCLPYDINGEKERMYPDFIIVRKDGVCGYVFDVLEPHNPTYNDNLPKAKGLADYARQDNNVARVQMIRVVTYMGKPKIVRLDMAKSAVREEVKRAVSSTELDHIFDNFGYTNTND